MARSSTVVQMRAVVFFWSDRVRQCVWDVWCVQFNSVLFSFLEEEGGEPGVELHTPHIPHALPHAIGPKKRSFADLNHCRGSRRSHTHHTMYCRGCHRTCTAARDRRRRRRRRRRKACRPRTHHTSHTHCRTAAHISELLFVCDTSWTRDVAFFEFFHASNWNVHTTT